MKKINLREVEQRAEPISQGLTIWAIFELARKAIRWVFDTPDSTYECNKCYKQTDLHLPICEHCHTDNPYWRET